MSLYGVIGYHVTLSEGHMIANRPHIWGDRLSCDAPYKETLVPHLVATLIYLSQNYSYYIRGDRSPLMHDSSHAMSASSEEEMLNILSMYFVYVHLFCSAKPKGSICLLV